MSGKNYSDLIVWQKAIEFVCAVYDQTRTFPADERFGLTSQIRRAAVSIPANIAEGQGRTSKKEFLNFLSIAHGSLREVETFIVIARRLNFLKPTSAEPLLIQAGEVGRLLNGLMRSLRRED